LESGDRFLYHGYPYREIHPFSGFGIANMTGPSVIPDEESVTSTSLLRGVRGNDQQSWRQLVKHYTARVYRWARGSGLGHDDADDVVQNVFVAVAGNVDRFQRRRKIGSFRRWLKVITVRKAYDRGRIIENSPGVGTGGSDHQRKLSEHFDPLGEGSLDDSGSSPVQPLTLELRAVIAKAQSRMKGQNQEIFEMTVMEGIDAQEVADRLGVSIGHVYTVKSRMIRRIRDRLGRQTTGQTPGQPKGQNKE